MTERSKTEIIQKKDAKNNEAVETASILICGLKTKGKEGRQKEKARSSGGGFFLFFSTWLKFKKMQAFTKCCTAKHYEPSHSAEGGYKNEL